MNITIDKTLLHEQFINRLLAKAERYSNRAGFSWLLLNDKDNILNCDGVIAGAQPEKLLSHIETAGYDLHRILFSAEPVDGVVDIQQLIGAIEASSCTHITLCHALPNDKADSDWRRWIKSWSGTIDYLPNSHVAKKLVAGVEMQKSSLRPWITAISATHFNGTCIPLESFIQEFGFQSYLHQMMLQTRVVLCATSQSGILEHLPEHNAMGEKIETYLISDPIQVSLFIHEITERNCFNALIFCDYPLLDYLLSQRAVDEIVYHLSNLDLNSDINFILNQNDTRFALSSNEWKIASSAVVGNCNRILFSRHSAEEINIASTPGRRLN